MSKKIWIILIIVVLIISGTIAYFFISNNAKTNQITGNATKNNQFVKTWTAENLGELEVDKKVVGYILYELGANELKKVPLTSNTPKLEVQVDNSIFNAEVKNKVIITNEGSIEDADIKIIMTRNDVINIINSTSRVKAIEESINNGTMKIEQKSSVKTLFLKGYLGIYKKFTGKKITIE